MKNNYGCKSYPFEPMLKFNKIVIDESFHDITDHSEDGTKYEIYNTGKTIITSYHLAVPYKKENKTIISKEEKEIDILEIDAFIKKVLKFLSKYKGTYMLESDSGRTLEITFDYGVRFVLQSCMTDGKNLLDRVIVKFINII